MQEIEIKHWHDFEAEIQNLTRQRERREAETGRRLNDPLFRGLGNSKWGPRTTLERSYPQDRSDETLSFLKYYRKVAAAKPAVETLTRKRWDEVPDFLHFKNLLRENENTLDQFLDEQPRICEYLTYLRHHAFPSPLLDWTASPYVAALFALDIVAQGVEEVCVYAILQDAIRPRSSKQHLFIVGPYIKSHPRHYAQQSRYSICVATEGEDYVFVPHEQAVSRALGPKGQAFKLRIRANAKERLLALKHLDLMNINPFSVYGTEDSLIRTIARRECLFQRWDL